VIEMPQQQVMSHGFGLAAQARAFPVIDRFLTQTLSIPFGSYHFSDLVRLGFASRQDRTCATNLYTSHVQGEIYAGDAAYIYGTVAIAVMSSSVFNYTAREREVVAELGALDDNWDFESNTLLASVLNPVVAVLLGPDHYNLEAPIRIRFFGSGRVVRERETVNAGSWFRGFF
jgi:hypothetical protein